MATEEQPESIYLTRTEEMVSEKRGECTERFARFLKPCAKHINQAVGIPNTPLLSDVFPHNLQQWPSKVFFKGWNRPQKKWKEWVDKLAPKYSRLWIKTGIHDAITSSIYEQRCNQDVVLGLSEYWCFETNTFVFPWGEATVTLEDIAILGGYPVLGEPVTSPLTREFMKIEQDLILHRREISRGKSKKPAHSVWLNHFMKSDCESELEHAAFLSLWLSRYVLPSLSGDLIGLCVFPVAVKLSQGVRVALAQAVLASLYKNLRVLRGKAMDSSEIISISGPFQLLQIWAFERFQPLGPKPRDLVERGEPPKSRDLVERGEPRAARWHKLSSKLNFPLVRSALRIVNNFQWRPYADNLKNWDHPSYYQETQQFVIGCSRLDDQEEVQSFLKYLQACELIGIDCKEKYLPHRVAMQFGMDQDLPADVSNFNLGNQAVKFFVPSRSCQPAVSLRYSNWWKDMISTREGLLRRREMNYSPTSSSSAVDENVNNIDGHATVEGRNLNDPTPSVPQSEILQNAKTPSKDLKTPRLSIKNDNVVDISSGGDDDDDDIPIARPVGNSGYEDSDDDFPIEIISHNFACSTSSAVSRNTRKRKLPASKEGISPKQEPMEFVDNSVTEPEAEVGTSKNKADGFAREVKREPGCSVNDKSDTAKGREKKMGGESLNNPIDLDDCTETTKSISHNLEEGIEGRLRKLEKMLGVIQD